MNNEFTVNWEKISMRLKDLREDNGLSHERLAEELTKKYGGKINKSERRISKQSLIDYEVSNKNHSKAGKVKGMSIENLYMLADFYEVSADYILCKTPHKSPDITVKDMCNKTGLSENAVNALKESNEFSGKEDALKVMPMLNKILEHKNFKTLLADICKCEINVGKVEEETKRIEKLSSTDIKKIKLGELFKESLDVEAMGEYYISPRKHLEISLYLLQKEFIEIIEDIINSKNVTEEFDEFYNK